MVITHTKLLSAIPKKLTKRLIWIKAMFFPEGFSSDDI